MNRHLHHTNTKFIAIQYVIASVYSLSLGLSAIHRLDLWYDHILHDRGHNLPRH